MQRDEGPLLEAWCKFHGHLVGFENIVILDNGSRDAETLDFLRYAARHLNVKVCYRYDSTTDFNNKGNIIADLINHIDRDGEYDFFFPLDCDEFIGCHARLFGYSCDKAKIMRALTDLRRSEAPLKISQRLFNSPIEKFGFYPEPGWRPRGKYFFPRMTANIEQLDLGFHEYILDKEVEARESSIVYFHLHNRPYEVMQRAARNKLDGRVLSFEKRALDLYEGPGVHLVRYLLKSKEAYLSEYAKLPRIRTGVLSKALSDLKLDTLVSDILRAGRSQLCSRSKRREKRRAGDNPWLLLCHAIASREPMFGNRRATGCSTADSRIFIVSREQRPRNRKS